MVNEKFAWFPRRVTSGKWIWFSKYYEHVELFDKSTGRPPLMSFDFRWTETPKEKTFRLLKEKL